MTCTISSITEIAQGTLEVILCPALPYPAIQAGQYTQFTIPNPAYTDTKPTEALCNKRIFSFVQAPTDEVDVSLQAPADGATEKPNSSKIIFATRLSNSAFKRSLAELKVGDIMEVGNPMGKFVLPLELTQPAGQTNLPTGHQTQPSELVFLAGGIGVTPFISMLDYLENLAQCAPLTGGAPQSAPNITMIYANNNIATMAYKERLEAQAQRMPNFTLHLSIHNDPAWQGESRFISADLLAEHIPNHQDKIFMMVGPPPMIRTVKPILLDELAIPAEQVMVEGFTGY